MFRYAAMLLCVAMSGCVEADTSDVRTLGPEEATVRAFLDDVAARRGDDAVKLMSGESIKEFEQLRQAALYATKEELSSTGGNAGIILAMRVQLAKETLIEPSSAFAAMLNAGIPMRNGWVHQVKVGRAYALNGELRVPLVFGGHNSAPITESIRLVNENGWRLSGDYLQALWSANVTLSEWAQPEYVWDWLLLSTERKTLEKAIALCCGDPRPYESPDDQLRLERAKQEGEVKAIELFVSAATGKTVDDGVWQPLVPQSKGMSSNRPHQPEAFAALMRHPYNPQYWQPMRAVAAH